MYPLLFTIAGWHSTDAVEGVCAPSLLLESSGEVWFGRLLVERLGAWPRCSSGLLSAVGPNAGW